MTHFTRDKQTVRELNLRAMRRYLGDPQESGGWAYFGLPAPDMEDVLEWQEHLRSVDAVERGVPGREWKAQHDLARTAVLNGVPRFTLHKADIDQVMLSEDGIEWEFDVVNLDYTGGITYKGEGQKSRRVEALRVLVQKQGRTGTPFFLIITVNDRHQDQGEIRTVLGEIARVCRKRGKYAEEAIGAIAKAGDARISVFCYTAHVIAVSAQPWFRTEVLKPILYRGKGAYRMLNMSFYLGVLPARDAPVGESFDITKLPCIEPINLEVGDQP